MNEGSFEEWLTTKDAAELMGYTLQHTRLLIRSGKLSARKLGRDWLIERASLESLLSLRKEKGLSD